MLFDRIHPEDLTIVQRMLDRASGDGKDFDFEHRLQMPDGAVKYVHVVAHAFRNRVGILRFVGALMDVTAAKGVEDALRESEQRFRDFTESASDWYWETGLDHRFIIEYEQLATMPIRKIDVSMGLCSRPRGRTGKMAAPSGEPRCAQAISRFHV
jgi:PAS domain-containing protein